MIRGQLKVLVTCGPTWVAIDNVRVISNMSTGEMGHLIARQFQRAGARVTLIEGPVTHAWQAKGIRVIKYRFFDELAKALSTEARKKYDIVAHAAAVSDFKTASVSKTKITSDHALTLRLIPTQKLIKAIKRVCPQSFVVGFKLGSKLSPKNVVKKTKTLFTLGGCDAVVANTAGKIYRGFIVNADGHILAKGNSKLKIAHDLVRLVL